jgi:hypothetical protein
MDKIIRLEEADKNQHRKVGFLSKGRTKIMITQNAIQKGTL